MITSALSYGGISLNINKVLVPFQVVKNAFLESYLIFLDILLKLNNVICCGPNMMIKLLDHFIYLAPAPAPTPALAPIPNPNSAPAPTPSPPNQLVTS